jgi:ssDNA-binding Zn-finger/Zn-ribbon topoisomerase 1
MLKQPESMEECVYFTRRAVGEGKIMCWVFREKCPKCQEGLMGKPKDEAGKVKIIAKEYVCPKCGHSVEKKEYEETLTANIQYSCPECKHSGEVQIPFKRKNIQGVQTLRFRC